MKHNYFFVVILALAAITVPVLIAAQVTSPPTPESGAVQSKTQSHSPTTQQNEGERIFLRNCARCHAQPEGFSSRISETIVRHMRVRANLSQHDEQELLRFFNP